MIITFTVPGDPFPKLRPRFRHVVTRAGASFTSAYTPAKSAKYEKAVKTYAMLAMRQAGQFTPFLGGLELDCQFFMPVPKSWTKRATAQALQGELPHTSRPDLDNLVKSIKDGLNEVVWQDDSQVVSLLASKFYSAISRAVIKVRTL